MKKTILSLAIALVASWTQGQTVVNGGFEDWGATVLTTYPSYTGFDKFDLTSVKSPFAFATTWELSGGSSIKEDKFQVLRGAGRTGDYALAFMSNDEIADARFYNSTVMELGIKIYKLRFYIKGKATIKNILLSKLASGHPNSGNYGLTATSGDIIVPTNYSTICKAYDLSNTWTEVTATFSIPTAANYKVYFSILSSADFRASALSPVNDFFMIDDITIAEDADPTICTLSKLTLRGAKIDNFSASTLTYNVIIAKTSTIPQIVGIPTDSQSATIEYTQIADLSGTEEQRTATAVVTAADGTTKKSYKIIVTMTDDILMEGFTGDATPSSWTVSPLEGTAYSTWHLDSSNNHGSYWGTGGIRPRGGADTDGQRVYAGDITLPVISEAGTLSFWIKSATSPVVGTFTAKWKLDSDTDEIGNWNELETLTNFPMAYEEMVYTLNQSLPVNIRFSFTKVALVTYPFMIDDVKVTKFSIPSTIGKNSIASATVYVENGRLILSTDQAESYRIVALNGKVVAQSVAANAVVELSKGIYFIEVGGAVYKVAVQ